MESKLDTKSALLSPDVFTLLESQEIQTADGIKQLIQENLSSTKESWLVHCLLDYYFLTQSNSVVEILCAVKEPHDKFLIDKLNDGIKSQDRQLNALQLLLHIVCKQPLWLDKVVTCGLIKTIIKTLKTDASVVVLTTCVTIVTILLPSVPTLVGNYLPDLFEIFNKLASYSIKKPPGNTPDIFHLHLQIAVYGLFHRLYGMFPYNLLSYLRQYFHKKEHTQVFEEVIKHMLERVRLHPKLVTVQDKEHEISTQMWRQLETHDIVVECNKMSLDPVEGIWEELQCPIVAARYISDKTRSHRDTVNSSVKPKLVSPPSSSALHESSNQTGSSVFWSPAEIIGLSTPPPTPNVPSLEASGSGSSHVGPAVVLNTSLTPLTTPVDTPPVSDDYEKVTSRSGSRGARLSLESKRLSSEMPVVQPVPLLTPSSHIPSIPPSPLKAEFTNTPPLGVKTLPVINAARELQFDENQSDERNLSHVTRINQTKVELSKQVTKTDQSDTKTVESTTPSTDKGFSRSGSSHAIESSINEATPTNLRARAMTTGSGVSNSDTVSVDTISQVIEGLERQASNDEDNDEEVSELTSYSRSNFGQHVALTSESVKKFMKSVNRIRFNSLTATNGTEPEQVKFRSKRSRSCPQFPKIETMQEEDDESLSRSMSASCEDSSQSEINLSSDKATGQEETATKVKAGPSADEERTVLQSTTSSTVTVSTKTETTVKITTTQTTETSKCPVSTGKTDTTDGDNKLTDLMLALRQVLNVSSSNICSKCQGQMTEAHLGATRPFFSTYTPPELLDRHICLGRDIHAKELSKLPIPSNQDVNWTHFGGVPPADEMSIIRGQLALLHNQLMYERHKRDQHAKRNRRLLRKIAHTKTLEEQNRSMTEVVKSQEKEIANLKESMKLLETKNRKLQENRDEEEYGKLVQLKACLQENEDLKNVKKELNILLIKQREEQDQLTKKLKTVEARLFNKEREVETMQEVAAVNTKMKDQILQLQKEVLLMGELQQKCNDKLQSMKISRATKLEHDKAISTLERELKEVRKDCGTKTALLESCQQQLKEQQEMLINKEVALTDIKAAMEKVKTSHYDEIKSVDDKYLAALRVNQTLEAHILQLHMELEVEKAKHLKGGLRTTVSTEMPPDLKLEEAPEEFRERTNSDPLQKSPSKKKKLTRMTSLPVTSMSDNQPSRSLESSQRSLEFSGYQSSVKEEDFEVVDAQLLDTDKSDTHSMSSRD